MRTFHLLLLISALLFISLSGCSDSKSTGGKWTDIEGGRFIADAQGRALILHGMNFMGSNKGAEHHMPWVTKEQAQVISRDWGMNVVRFLILWSGLEPQPFEYDEDYFDRIEAWLDFWHSEGVYVILDMHQDVYAAKFCCDGAPDWAIRDDDLPFEMQSAWFANYFEPAVQRAFDNLWNYEGEHSDLQDHYMALWQKLAVRFKDHPAVMGYDIINEPHPGSDFDALEAIGMENPNSKSPEFDRTKLGPFYQRVTNAIREVDDENWIFFEPRYGAPGNGFPSWVPKIIDPRKGQPRIFYYPHLYSIKLENDGAYDLENDPIIESWETQRTIDVERQNCPMAIGEWGLDPNWPNALIFMKQVCDMADRMLAGWTYWTYDPGGWSIIDGEFNERESADILVRPYPLRVAGIPTKLSFDIETKAFRLEYKEQPGVTSATQLHIPARHYPNGFTLTVDGQAGGKWKYEWDASRDMALVKVPHNGKTRTIAITPK